MFAGSGEGEADFLGEIASCAAAAPRRGGDGSASSIGSGGSWTAPGCSVVELSSGSAVPGEAAMGAGDGGGELDGETGEVAERQADKRLLFHTFFSLGFSTALPREHPVVRNEKNTLLVISYWEHI